jgi:two-component system, NarL family, sensor histidine kinase DegS
LADQRVDIKALDTIFSNMLRAMDQSKNDIFIISERSRKSFDDMKAELEMVENTIARLLTENNQLEEKSRSSRKRLAEVSKNFASYSESEIREAYETANKLLIDLSVNEMEEKQMQQRHFELEKRMSELLETMHRADQLVNRVSSVVNYLMSDLQNVGEALQDASLKQNFAISIIEAQEEERKRLSRDIHDGPAQMLANVLLRSGLIEKVYAEKGADLAFQELNELKETVRDALSEVRRIIYNLRPMALDDLGLVPTLEKYLSSTGNFERATKIHFFSIGEPLRLPTNIEISVFRLVQESVTNAIKHGHSKDVWVKIEWLRDILNIEVKDNGKGFDLKEVRDKSFGLIGMRERVELLKGEMKISSTPGKWTKVTFGVPLKSAVIDALIEN